MNEKRNTPQTLDGIDAHVGREFVAEGHSYVVCEDILGVGGQAIIFAACRDTEPDADYVIKIPHEYNLEMQKRLARELHVGKLEHEHLVGAVAIAHCLSSEDVGLISKRIHGTSLRNTIHAHRHKKEPPIPLDKIVRYGIQIADALQFLHENDYVHRDMKPGNILIAGEKAFLGDFGLCDDQNASESLTRTGVVPGTSEYMAPEQEEQGKTSPQSDIYSLGMVLYESATGERIRSPKEIKLSDIPKDNGVSSHHFAAVIDHCLQYSAKKRYTTVSDLKADLESIAANEVPKRYRVIQGRKKRLFLLRTIAAMALACLIGVAAWSSVSLLSVTPPPEFPVAEEYPEPDAPRFRMPLPNGNSPFRLLQDEDYPKITSETEMMLKMMEVHQMLWHPGAGKSDE